MQFQKVEPTRASNRQGGGHAFELTVDYMAKSKRLLKAIDEGAERLK